MVIVVAAHPCEAVTQVWLNNKPITLQLDTQFADESNPNGFYQSFDPPQGNWQIETISRTNNVVSVTFTQNQNSLLTAFNGQTFRIENSRDAAGGNSFDGYFPVVQTGDASFTYTCGGPQGMGTGNPGTVVSTWPQYQGTVTVGYYLGNQTQASGIIIGNTAGYWTPACILAGFTYVAMKLTYNPEVYNGLPEISFVVNGKNNIYDPRTGTTGFTNNAALCIADYLNQPVFGFNIPYGKAAGTTVGENIPFAGLVSAANICDEQVSLALGGSENRYSCDGAFDVSVKRGEVLQNLLTSCAGRLVVLGGLYTIFPAAWVTPSGAITVGGCGGAPKMMMNSNGLVAQSFNSPAGSFVPSCAGTTESEFVYALGLLNAYQVTGNSNAKALAQLIMSALEPFLFAGLPVPARVTSTSVWTPNSFFDVKQAFLGDAGATIQVNQNFAEDFLIPAGWRSLVGAELQTLCDAYNWAMRLLGVAAEVFDGATPGSTGALGYGLSPYGPAPYGDPEVASAPSTSGWLTMLTAIQQMARIAYMMQFVTPELIVVPQYQGGMIPYLAEFTGTPAPALSTWQGPAYVGMQSPWAVQQVNPATTANAVQFLAEAQATLEAGGTVADTVVVNITGVNPQTISIPIQINSAGQSTASFSYAGANVGTDTIIATLPSHSLSSNHAEMAWSAYPVEVAVFNVLFAVMSADGSGLFNSLSPVLSSTVCQGLMFNTHPNSYFPGDPHQSGNQANPFVSNAVGVTGTYNGDLPIPNTSGPFNAVITFTMAIELAGEQTFTVLVNSAFVVGFAGAVSYVSGPTNFGALAGGTAQNNYPPLAGLNVAGDWPGGTNWATVTFTVNFTAPGLYQGEIDYASGLYSEREFCLLLSGLGSTTTVIPNVGILDGTGGATATGTAPTGYDLQLTPYSGGLAIGQMAYYTLVIDGLTYTGPASGPFAPVYQFTVPTGVTAWGPQETFGWFGPNPNYNAGYFQYRPLAELCDLIAGAAGTEAWYSQAVGVKNNFLTWLVGKWTVASSGPPNYFPQTGAQTTAVDVHCAALILYSVLSLDLALRPTGAGGPGAMNTTGYALLLLVHTLFADTYLHTGPMAGTFCIDPTGAQDWSPIWSGEILRALSKLVTWANVNGEPTTAEQAIVWIDGLVNFGLNNVVAVDPNLGYTVDDCRGGVTWRPKLARTELFNGVKGTYISQANNWQQADFPSYAQDQIHGYTNGTPAHNYDANWDADGQRLWRDVQLPFTTSVSMAQRIAKIELLRIRWQGRGMVVGMMTMYESSPLDVIYFSFPGLGWINKVLELANCRLVQQEAETGGVKVFYFGTELDLQESDPSVYEWNPYLEELNNQGYSYLPGLANLSPD